VPSALVVIDVQQGLFTCQPPPYRGDDLLQTIAGLLARARAAGLPVFHVRHDGGSGHILARGSAGWPHHPDVAPQVGETIVDKRQSSAFHDTDFHTRLQACGIDRVVVAGIQTEMCVESTCRAAVAHGYQVVLVSDAHTTFDTPVLPAERIIAHHNHTLGKGFAQLARADEVRFQES
jgi:nicotinamidase-related amidase